MERRPCSFSVFSPARQPATRDFGRRGQCLPGHDARLRHLSSARAEAEEAQHRCAAQAASHESALAVAALDEPLVGKQVQRLAQGAERDTMLGGQGRFGGQRGGRRPFTCDDAFSKRCRQRPIPALSGLRLQDGDGRARHLHSSLVGHEIWSSRSLSGFPTYAEPGLARTIAPV